MQQWPVGLDDQPDLSARSALSHADGFFQRPCSLSAAHVARCGELSGVRDKAILHSAAASAITATAAIAPSTGGATTAEAAAIAAPTATTAA